MKRNSRDILQFRNCTDRIYPINYEIIFNYLLFLVCLCLSLSLSLSVFKQYISKILLSSEN
ncbi:hypothetical protein DFA_07211 [Cavenderia fasciculata]|uniref:Uncharacterized protein n=1 Tax=Cavenderia fasciculata TaxID=261658 RepID=F4PVT0_CACFS|nr:uncharacterized protein DFA_07211 [Cavenderia fasciculata]EGG20094.1 hypothetical protein DFA_07211 [Cavenderia fasciculata]|eukprot:XP_004367077.1 hypothetical protein DFA_07211 [Cavenderia fasciculata]